MVKKIRLLPPFIANQIAAGEVIERPASVVKELLENAIDSGADCIHVDIKGGGFTAIRVSDNGIGIPAEDLELAITAHATSKIETLNDLYALSTMGFRGEALASIASIANLTIFSKTAQQSDGMRLDVKDKKVAIVPYPRTNGTTIEVNDLFYNAPVRKKFLKGESQEFQIIESMVRKLAFSAPKIALTLTHNSKQIFSLSAVKTPEGELLRIRKMLGKKFLETAGFLECERAGVLIRGWVSGPEFQRNQNDKQWVYINHRFIKDKLIQHAIKKGYQDLLHPGKYPSYLLFIKIPPNEVDVNVHPTKQEVRFQNPRMIHDLVTAEIANAVDVHFYEQKTLSTQVPSAKEHLKTYYASYEENHLHEMMHSGELSRARDHVSKATLTRKQENEIFYAGGEAHELSHASGHLHGSSSQAYDFHNLSAAGNHSYELQPSAHISHNVSNSSQELFGLENNNLREKGLYLQKKEYKKHGYENATHEPTSLNFLPIGKRFLLVTVSNVPILINLSELLYNQAQVLLSKNAFPLTARRLLVPISITCHHATSEKLWYFLKKFGFEINTIGKENIVVRTIPRILPYLCLSDFIKQFSQRRNWNDEDIINLLSSTQILNITEVSFEEKMQLWQFIEQHYNDTKWAIVLNELHCQELLKKQEV